MPSEGGRRGRRDNGLDAAAFVPLVDVDPRVGEHLLDVLAVAGVPAYLEPSADIEPYTRALSLPSPPTDRLWVARDQRREAREIVDAETPHGTRPAPVPREDEPSRGSGDLDEERAWQEILSAWAAPAVEPTRFRSPAGPDIPGPEHRDRPGAPGGPRSADHPDDPGGPDGGGRSGPAGGIGGRDGDGRSGGARGPHDTGRPGELGDRDRPERAGDPDRAGATGRSGPTPPGRLAGPGDRTGPGTPGPRDFGAGSDYDTADGTADGPAGPGTGRPDRRTGERADGPDAPARGKRGRHAAERPPRRWTRRSRSAGITGTDLDRAAEARARAEAAGTGADDDLWLDGPPTLDEGHYEPPPPPPVPGCPGRRCWPCSSSSPASSCWPRQAWSASTTAPGSSSA